MAALRKWKLWNVHVDTKPEHWGPHWGRRENWNVPNCSGCSNVRDLLNICRSRNAHDKKHPNCTLQFTHGSPSCLFMWQKSSKCFTLWLLSCNIVVGRSQSFKQTRALPVRRPPWDRQAQIIPAGSVANFNMFNQTDTWSWCRDVYLGNIRRLATGKMADSLAVAMLTKIWKARRSHDPFPERSCSSN